MRHWISFITTGNQQIIPEVRVTNHKHSPSTPAIHPLGRSSQVIAITQSSFVLRYKAPHHHKPSDSSLNLRGLSLRVTSTSRSIERSSSISGLNTASASIISILQTPPTKCLECGVGLAGKAPRRERILPRMLSLDYDRSWRCCRSGRSI